MNNYKKWKIQILLVCIIVSLGIKCLANERPRHKNVILETDSLRIGTIIHNNDIFTIKNYPTKTVKLSDFRGKLLILDFWSTWCSSCIKAMPEMARLQNQFKNKIQIILVTKDKQEAINKLRSSIVQTTSLPIIVGDTILSRIFHYRSVPTHVWIDTSGNVIQMTDGYNTTVQNIQKYFEGRKINLAAKSEKEDFNNSTPLWLEGNGRQISHLLYYSFITNQITDLEQSIMRFERDSLTNKMNQIRLLNLPVLNLFKIAFNGDSSHVFDSDNRVILRIADTGSFRLPADTNKWAKWTAKNEFSYELKIPVGMSDKIFEIMKQDLNRFFGLYGQVENRMVKCLVLRRTSEKDKLHSSGEKSSQTTDELGFNTKIRNKPLSSSLIHALSYANKTLSTPIVDGTNYSGNVDLDIHTRLNNITKVRAELVKYDLELIEEYKALDMLIISDNTALNK